MTLTQIKDIQRFDFGELEKRLRQVRLKGFPDVRIYGSSEISIHTVTPEKIKANLFIPQPSIYREGYLERLAKMDTMFQEKEVNMQELNGGVDYTAVDETGAETCWTLIPPVVEKNSFVFSKGKLDYASLIGNELSRFMKEKGFEINPELQELNFEEYPSEGTHIFSLINDGSHRIHYGLEKGVEQNILVMSNNEGGFPYYAAPQPYSIVQVFDQRPEDGGQGKVHVLTSPGHKALYRLFPSGGILSGDVRPDKHLKDTQK